MEQKEYVVTIKNQTGSGGRKAVAGDTTGTDAETSKGILSQEQAKAFGMGMIAYHQVKSFATQVINHKVSTVQLRTGSNELQERANFINRTVQQGVGIIESVGMGALMGGLGGALIGLTIGTAHTVMGYVQQQNVIDTQKNLENQSLQMNYIRAGARGSRGNYEQF